jgi:hypothetical protein
MSFYSIPNFVKKTIKARKKSSKHAAHTSLLTPHCSPRLTKSVLADEVGLLTAHGSQLIPCCWLLVAHTSLLTSPDEVSVS